MKLVVQRVTKASVIRKNTGEIVGAIGLGMFVLVGFGKQDNEQKVASMVKRIVKLRIMSDDMGKMNKTVTETGSSMLIVSQFTLYTDTNGGNRPSFINAMDPDRARDLYNHFVELLRYHGVTVATGSFGDYMEINATLDGPVTITFES